jgi:hypothetical protein
MTTDRLAHLDDEDLGRTLGALDLRWPPVPEVTASVLRDIDRGRESRRRLSRTTVVILVAAAILAIAAAAAAARFAFDLGGIAIRSVPTLPTLPASPVEPSVVGHAVSATDAERALGEPLPIPATLGPPDVVWLERDITSFEPTTDGIVVAMAWRPGPRLPRIPGTPYGATLFAFRGEQVVAIKTVAGRVHQVPEHDATWIETPHQLDLLVDGRMRTFRVTGAVLIWQDGDLALRLETALPRADAVHIAFPSGT